MALTGGFSVRPAQIKDREQIAQLIFDENSPSHRHLDWRTPLEWIGSPPYFVIEDCKMIQSVLACPTDPPGIAWIRVFACSASTSPQACWNILWHQVQEFYQGESRVGVCVITLHDWFKRILENSRFQHIQQITSLIWNGLGFSQEKSPGGIRLRTMEIGDIPRVALVDSAAFDLLWQNSEQSLNLAFDQASLVTVALYEGEIVGYQLSTTNIIGGHLARLAVLPELQGKGIGRSLVSDMIHRFTKKGIHSISVNTQSDNTASLCLYKSAGFIETGERFPVYKFTVN